MAEVFPGIESDQSVCGGAACIANTRIPVWLLVQAQRLGSNDSDILKSYPTLHPNDLTNAWAFARLHREEIEREIAENESA